MRFESVTAYAFGPFTNRSLRFSEGLTVVFGLNEAGKSTWHAALYAGLCGLRRGRGAPSKEDREFGERHRPWDGGGWEVGTTILLEDGRRVEIRQDLEGGVACRATDVILGRDYSNEIMYDGAPDGSRWLELNRRSFLTTACVRQADLLLVAESAGLLQQHLQRAAATSGTDATAAEAIRRIDGFRRDQVGLDQANSIRPLRRALERVSSAEQTLTAARGDHQEYLSLLARLDELAARQVLATAALRQVEAAQALNAALQLERRVARVKALQTSLPEGAPPAAPEQDSLAQAVASALAAWQQRPIEPNLVGTTAAELRRKLDTLPTMPAGDCAPQADLIQAHATVRAAQLALEAHRAVRPAEAARPNTGGASEADLQALVQELAAAIPEVDGGLLERRDRARRRVAQLGQRRTGRGVLVAAGGAIVLGVGAAVLGQTGLGVLLALFGLGLGVWSFRRSGNGAQREARKDLEVAEAGVRAQQQLRDEALRRREAAQARAAALGLPTDPTALGRIIAALATADRLARDAAAWASRAELLASELDGARTRFRALLAQCGVAAGDDLEAALAEYQAACRARAEQAAQAAQRPGLLEQLAVREKLEARASEDAEQRRRAVATLREVAARLEVVSDSEAELARGLRRWQTERAATLELLEAQRNDWAELQGLLDGTALGQLGQELNRLQTQARRLAEGVDDNAIAPLRGEPALPELLQERRAAEREAGTNTTAARAQVEERAARLRSVAEAEEELAAARTELERVRRLDETLGRARKFLEAAQDRVHRSIAPVLAASVRRWLSQVTTGRYSDVRVDPETLAVQVCGSDGRWRDASLLSRGTSEQIYLLLRVALAEHLTRSGEVCPLLLDDVTVQSDTERTAAILAALHTLSRERQVILFSQESQVLAWGRSNLRDPRDTLVELQRLELASSSVA